MGIIWIYVTEVGSDSSTQFILETKKHRPVLDCRLGAWELDGTCFTKVVPQFVSKAG
jgi:hypothetical protein